MMKKRMFIFLMGLVIGLALSGIVTYAATVISASSIKYTDTYNISATNVQDAIDKVSERVKNFNSKDNIVVAYKYNDTTCVSGDEATCEVSDCYKTKTANSCSSGTIIKFRVNSKETKTFYVLHDDGSTITLQQRENIIRNDSWNSENTNAKGPITILQHLESATSNWVNVNTQTYTMGTTNFNNTNAYTGCSSNGSNISCSTNTYTLATRTARARMITLQEAYAVGCRPYVDSSSVGSCPKWMYNYLENVTSLGGSIDDNTITMNDKANKNYWTMTSISSSSTAAWHVGHAGYLGFLLDVTTTDTGARAVVVISK